MSFDVSILADSISETGERITTFKLRYPRFIHSEFMTHRVFSRNASSSRAIPFKRLVRAILQDPAMPVYWGINKPGMQAGDELGKWGIRFAKFFWLTALYFVVAFAYLLHWLGLHKQVVNRLLEPWSHITVVVTATEYSNFFKLRCHKDAQPEIKYLADKMFILYNMNTPQLLKHGEWHLPYITQEDHDKLTALFTRSQRIMTLCKVSAARCARTSYETFDGKRSTINHDVALCNKLVSADVIHASPFEHQATPDLLNEDGRWRNPALHGNLHGWVQHRKLIENAQDKNVS